MQQSSTQLLFMQVETQSRELDARLAVASRLAAPGREFWIGSFRALHTAASALPATWLAKHAPLGAESYHRDATPPKRVVFLDEEGAFYHGDEEAFRHMVRRRVPWKQLRPGDTVACWGDTQRALLEEDGREANVRVVTTGNPRFELGEGPLRSLAQTRGALLHARHGPYVLVNTSFASANSVRNTCGVLESLQKRRGAEKARESWLRSTHALLQMLEIVITLRRHRPQLRIIVRPHPGESEAFYRTFFAEDPGILVCREDAALQWIAGARAILCDNCTTSVEACLLGVPAIQPPIRNEDDTAGHILRHFCHSTDSIEHLCERIDDVLEGRLGSVAIPKVEGLPERVHNLRAPGDAALDPVLVDAMNEVPAIRATALRRALLHLRPRLLLRTEAGRIGGGLLALTPERREWRAYARGKFPGFRADDIRERIADLRSWSRAPLEVDFLSSELVRLYTPAEAAQRP